MDNNLKNKIFNQLLNAVKDILLTHENQKNSQEYSEAFVLFLVSLLASHIYSCDQSRFNDIFEDIKKDTIEIILKTARDQCKDATDAGGNSQGQQQSTTNK